MRKRIKNYPEYEICSNGQVYSLRRNTFLKPIVTKKGYTQVNLSVNGKRKAVLIHRLVAEAFIPNPDNLPEIDHIDTNRANNNVDNLRWCTRQENENNPLTRKHISESSPYKRPIIAIAPDGTITEYESLAEAERTGLFDHRGISAVCSGKQKTHRGYKFEYKTN